MTELLTRAKKIAKAGIAFALLLLFVCSISTTETYALSTNPNIIHRKAARDTVYLFHGRSLKNLKFIWRNKADYHKKLYEISNGAIIFRSHEAGYIRSKKKYGSFVLHAEWAWLSSSENGNSGILIYIQKPDVVWPECIQVNYKNQHAGDFISMKGTFFPQAKNKPKGVVPIMNKPSEKPLGEWNTCKVVCEGDSVMVYVNGVFQNKATNVTLKPGYIGFQMEGLPVKFRDMYIVKK